MAISFVAERKAPTSLGATSPATFSPATNTTVGNFLVLLLGSSGASTSVSVSDSKGNTWSIDIANATTRYCAIATAQVTTQITTSDTIQVTWTTGTMRVQLEEFSGVATSSPLDQTASNHSAVGSTTVDCGTTATTTQSDEVVIGAFMTNDNTTYAGSNSYTIFNAGSSLSNGVYLIVSSTGTQNPTANLTGAGNTSATGMATATYKALVVAASPVGKLFGTESFPVQSTLQAINRVGTF